MSNIQILFQLPAYIESGLTLGTYERVGAVIRDSQTKQVVMWLREGGEAASNPKAMNGLMASVMRQSGMSSAAMGAILGSTLMTVNLAMSGYTLYLMVERVRELEQQIEALHERVSEEFARDRRVEFEAALSNARDVVDAENDAYKQQAANQAINQLFKAQQHRLQDFDQLVVTASGFDQLQQAQNYLLQAMMTSTMRVRCFLETDQFNVARSRLKEALDEYLPRTKHLIQKWLGEHPAIYFNSTISDTDFERYLQIETWVREVDDVLAILVKEYRSEFWNRDAIKPLSGLSFKLPFMNRSDTDVEPTYLEALTQAEVLIENYHRLLGFELELASMRLKFEEWDALVGDLETQEDYVLLVDQDALTASDRLSI